MRVMLFDIVNHLNARRFGAAPPVFSSASLEASPTVSKCLRGPLCNETFAGAHEFRKCLRVSTVSSVLSPAGQFKMMSDHVACRVCRVHVRYKPTNAHSSRDASGCVCG